MEDNKEVKEAIIEVHHMSEDEKMRRLADLREKAIMDEQLIKKAGYLQGRAKGESIGLAKGESIGLAKGESIGLEKGKKKAQENIINQC